MDREYEDIAAAVSRVDELPWPVEGPNPGVDQLDLIERCIANGDPDAALELALRVLVGASTEATADLRATPACEVRISLVHTWPREVRDIERLPRDLAALGAIATPTLLLRGEVTSPWLARATAAVARAIPSSDVIELAGQGHAALALAPTSGR